MAGFSLNGVYGRIPCPYCASKSCCGVNGKRLVCCSTDKVVSAMHLQSQADAYGMTRYKTRRLGGGWTAREITYASEDFAGHFSVGDFEVHHPDGYIVGNSVKTLTEAKGIAVAHKLQHGTG